MNLFFSFQQDDHPQTDDTTLSGGGMGYLQIIYIIAIVMYAVWLITALVMPCAIKKVFLCRLYITFRYIYSCCTCEMINRLAQSIRELSHKR